MNRFKNKKILLIICGGIAAYKSLELIRSLKKNGTQVKTILTKSATEFVTKLWPFLCSAGLGYFEVNLCHEETVG